ncbi:MAG: AAA family ATPase, partial [Candidatus Nanopelagicales bacterium]
MSGDPELLYGLLSSTFGDDSELERFLILNGYPTGAMYGRMKGSSRPYDVAVWFAEHDSEVEGLFDALRRRDPGRRADIDAAQAQYAEEAGPRRSYTVPDGRGLGSYGSAELDAFARRLRARLAAVPEPDPYGGALDPAVWPWTGAAAVLGGFRPDALRPLPGPPPADPAVVALSPFVYRLADGRWELREEIRRPAVERLVARPGSQPLVELPPGLSAALDANADLADPRRDALRQVQRSGLPPLFALTMAELDDLDAVLGWLPAEPASDLDDVFGWSPSRPTAEARSAVRAAIERRELMEPLRRLVGTRFVGRQRELRELREHLYPGRGPVDARLRLHGPGGTGKSSLIGRLLQDLEERAARAPASFAYVDFDRKQYDPRDARGLLLQIVRQLRLQQAGREEELAYVAYESSVGGTDAARVAEVLELDQNLELDGLVQVLARILSQTRVTYPTDVAPLVLVLDTFEEVQLKGPGPVAQVLALLDTIEAALPETRTIIAGRGLREGPGSGPLLPLGDLDPDAADAMLAAHGVADPGLRLLIVERFGGHPLTMRLAADVLARTGSADLAFDGIVGRAEALAEVSAEQVQGLLYERILGH